MSERSSARAGALPGESSATVGEASLVTVVMPAYEAAEFIGEALESALAQDHDPVEVIVVDDGSTDRTGELAASYGVRVIRQPNGGPAVARNSGLAAARGEFLTILDADDLWPADRLSAQVAHLREHPENGMVMGFTEAFLTPGQSRPAHYPKFESPFPGHVSTLMFRREVYELVGPYDASLRLSEDLDWLARTQDAGVQIGRLEQTLLRYRIHATNTSRNPHANSAATLRALRASVARKRAVDA